jgi:protein TonB
MKLSYFLVFLVLGNTIYAKQMVPKPNFYRVLVNVGDTSKKKSTEKKQVKEVKTVTHEGANEILIDDESIGDDSMEIFLEAEQAPTFKGGFDSLDVFLSKNLKYPTLAKENGIEGRIVVRFIIEKDGLITKTEILKKLGWGCDEEALRLIKLMPKWMPAKMNGKHVRTYFTLPIVFKLK